MSKRFCALPHITGPSLTLTFADCNLKNIPRNSRASRSGERPLTVTITILTLGEGKRMRFGPLDNGDGKMADLLRPGVRSARGIFGVTGSVRRPNDLCGDAIRVL